MSIFEYTFEYTFHQNDLFLSETLSNANGGKCTLRMPTSSTVFTNLSVIQFLYRSVIYLYVKHNCVGVLKQRKKQRNKFGEKCLKLKVLCTGLTPAEIKRQCSALA